MNNYLNFSDLQHVYFGVVKLEKNPDCITCGTNAMTVNVSSSITLELFLEYLKNKL